MLDSKRFRHPGSKTSFLAPHPFNYNLECSCRHIGHFNENLLLFGIWKCLIEKCGN